MIALLVAAALVVATGTTFALAARDQRVALLGLTVALLASVLLADPLPSPAALGVRLVAALLTVAVLRAAFAASAAGESDADTSADGFGWPAQILLGVAAAIVGLGLGGALAAANAAVIGTPGPSAVITPGMVLSGRAVAFGVSLFVGTLAAGPALLGAGPRRVIATLLLVQAVVELRTALAGPQSVLEQLVIGALFVVVATGVALLAVPITHEEGTT